MVWDVGIFFLSDLEVNIILMFVSYLPFVPTIQLCLCDAKAAIDNPRFCLDEM